jgi:hypothetical protein
MRLQRNGIILRVRLGVVELIRLRDQIVSNSEWVWEITRGGEDELALMMVRISYVVAMEFKR